MASWLVRSTPDRSIWVQALAGDIVLCYWERHSRCAFLYPYSVPANLMLGDNPAME